MEQTGEPNEGVVQQYAGKNGFALVIDISSPQTPVLFASPPLDITAEIVNLFDQPKSE